MFRLHAHVVFVTKCRHGVFADRHLKRMEEIMRAVCGDFECELVEWVGGAPPSIVRQHIEQHNRPVQARSAPAGLPRGPSPPP